MTGFCLIAMLPVAVAALVLLGGRAWRRAGRVLDAILRDEDPQ